MAKSTTAVPQASTVTVVNAGAQLVYLGGSDVTTANGFPLAAGQVVPFGLASGEVLYAIAAQTGQVVGVLAQGF